MIGAAGSRPRRRDRRAARVARALAAALLVAVPAGWLGLRAWYPVHLAQVTGRSDAPAVSCWYCHATVQDPPRGGVPGDPGYLSPTGLAVSPDGESLFVAASGADRLLKVDLRSGAVARSVEIPGRPHGVAVSADGATVAVSSRDGDEVRLVDAASLEVRATMTVAREPLGLALDPDGSRLFVAGATADRIAILPIHEPERATHLVAGREPYAVALSRDGALLVAVNRLAAPRPPGAVPFSEITLVDTRRETILNRRQLPSAHLSEGVALSADGSFALATAVRVRNLVPITQVRRGAVMNSELVFLETSGAARTAQLPLDSSDAYYADPAAVVLTPDDRLAFVAHAGARTVSAVDVVALRELVARSSDAKLEALADDLGVSARYVLARIPTRDNPGALALSPDGSRLYVAERLADSVAVVDTRGLEVVDRIDLGGPRTLTAARRGERLFTDASITFQGQFSCRSCHPDGNSDGLAWDFDIDGIGQNLVETRSLQGIKDTPPFKWNGKNPDLATQCGPRFAAVLTRSDPFSPNQLADLVTFIESIPAPRRLVPDDLAAARARGEVIFHRTATDAGRELPVSQRCPTCHRPPLFTDRLAADVGTGGAFDTPHLFGLRTSAPYLHDGRSRTLEEIWTVHNPDDTHGITNDLTKAQLNDLVVLLRSF